MNITPMKLKNEPHACELPLAGPRMFRLDAPRFEHEFIRCNDCGRVYKRTVSVDGFFWARKRFGLKKLEAVAV